LTRVFAQRRQSGRIDLEAVETAFRSTVHQAAAASLSELLHYEVPAIDQRRLPCPCGHYAQYQELRGKTVLTVVGRTQLQRPYYLCSRCHEGQFPADRELDVKGTGFSPISVYLRPHTGDRASRTARQLKHLCVEMFLSKRLWGSPPGVRRMLAVVGVGAEAPFDYGREQMKVLAGLEVTTKAVERTAEAIGDDIAQREQHQIQRAIQLDLPIVIGEPVAILYVQMDGTGIPARKTETVGRPGKTEGKPAHTREVKLGCVFWGVCSPRPHRTKKGIRSATRIRPPTPAPSRRPRSLASASTWKPGTADGVARKR